MKDVIDTWGKVLILDVQHQSDNCFIDSLDRLLYLKIDVWQKPLNKWICEFQGKHSDIKWMRFVGQEYSGLHLPVKIIMPNSFETAKDCFITKIKVCCRSSVPVNEITNAASNTLFYKIDFCYVS